jgi:hypothetical protein
MATSDSDTKTKAAIRMALLFSWFVLLIVSVVGLVKSLATQDGAATLDPSLLAALQKRLDASEKDRIDKIVSSRVDDARIQDLLDALEHSRVQLDRQDALIGMLAGKFESIAAKAKAPETTVFKSFYGASDGTLQCYYLDTATPGDAQLARDAHAFALRREDGLAIDAISHIQDEWFRSHILTYHAIPSIESAADLRRARGMAEEITEAQVKITAFMNLAVMFSSLKEDQDAMDALRKAGELVAEQRRPLPAPINSDNEEQSGSQTPINLPGRGGPSTHSGEGRQDAPALPVAPVIPPAIDSGIQDGPSTLLPKPGQSREADATFTDVTFPIVLNVASPRASGSGWLATVVWGGLVGITSMAAKPLVEAIAKVEFCNRMGSSEHRKAMGL